MTTFTLFTEKPTRSLSEFEFLQDPKDKNSRLGVGSFATVKLAREIKTGKLVALKMVNLENSKNKSSDLHNLRTEIVVHKRIDHANIIKYHGYIQEGTLVYIVLDYAEKGNLYSYLHKKKVLTNQEIFRFFYQTCLAIQQVHQQDVMHRDIKPENLLLDKELNIKLCDFGWSAERIRDKRTTFCGTYEYMAPEIIYKRPYDYRIDIWSLGILLYELIHKEAPYKGRSLSEICNSISKGPFTFGSHIDPQAKDLIQRILKVNPQERPSISQILSHPWVKAHTEARETPSFVHNSNKNDQSQDKGKETIRPISHERSERSISSIEHIYGKVKKPSNMTPTSMNHIEISNKRTLDERKVETGIKTHTKSSCSLIKSRVDLDLEEKMLVKIPGNKKRKTYENKVLMMNQKQSLNGVSSPANSTPTIDQTLQEVHPSSASTSTSIRNMGKYNTLGGHLGSSFTQGSNTSIMNNGAAGSSIIGQTSLSPTVFPPSATPSDISGVSSINSRTVIPSQKQRTLTNLHPLMNSRPFDPTVISPVAWGQGTSTTRHGVHQKTLTGISETSHFRRLFTEAQATPQSRLLYKGNRRLISPRGHEGSNGSNYANIKDIGSLVSPVAWSRRRIVSRPKNDILLGDYKSNDQGVLNNYHNVENLPSKTPMKMSEDKGDSGISFGKFVKGGDYKSKLIIRNGDNMNNGTIRVLRPAMKRMGNKENTISEIPKVEKGLVHIDKFYSPREPNYRVFLNQ